MPRVIKIIKLLEYLPCAFPTGLKIHCHCGKRFTSSMNTLHKHVQKGEDEEVKEGKTEEGDESNTTHILLSLYTLTT